MTGLASLTVMQQALEARIVDTGETTIRVRSAGSGPGVLLLHGFPETSLMWRDIAGVLARRFTVVCADLRGYGESGCPASSADHAAYSKRALARDMVAVMASLGFERFSVAGHDRGGRVAYRLALDHPQRIERLAVLDVVPVDVAWDRADDRFALGFWPWSLLAQAEPLPERLVGAAPEAVIDAALGPQWGTPASTFDAEIRAAYLAQLQDPVHVHAICEEYRAAAGIDREHDRGDREAGRRITCPLLTMWSAGGPLGYWYEDIGGPIAVWRELADDVSGRAVDGGHFFPEEHPGDTATALLECFASTRGDG
jgi:haloacetate dehalogenase